MKLFRKNVMKLTVPILMEQIFVMSMGTINTMMAGHISKEAVSAIGMVDSINVIFISFFTALSVGGTVVVAQYIGRGNIKRANEAMKQALYSGLLLSFIITLITWMSKHFLLSILFGAASDEVIRNAYTYLGITLLTYPMITMDLVANGILRGAGDTKTPMKITMFMNVLNVILSYFLIYGVDIRSSSVHIYIPSLGIKGAALGIAIARVTGALVILFVLIRGSKIVKLKNLSKFKFDKELLRSIFGIGIPASIESLLFNIGKLITQIYIVEMGTISIASNAIGGSVASMLNIPGNSLSIAATALVGQSMGRGKSEEADDVLTYITKLATISLTALGIIAFPLSRLLASLYTTNSDIIRLTANLLKVNSIFIPLWAVAFVLPSGLKGAGDVKYTMITAVIGMWVFRITLGYVLGLPLKLGLIGVWLGMYTDWLVRGILYYIRLKNGKWKRFSVIKKD